MKKDYLIKLLFVIGLAGYLFSRFYHLSEFPCYFHCDEAIHGAHARNLIENNLHDANGKFLPLYFEVAWNLNLSSSVYLQAIFAKFLGSSIEVVRGTVATFSFLASLCLALLVKNIFKFETWWTVIWFLLTMPIWLLHSRTGFEVGIFVSFYSIMFFGYYLWRSGNDKGKYICAASSIIAFYSYSAAQIYIPVTLVAFFINDFSYNFKRIKELKYPILLHIICLIPYVRFRILNSTLLAKQLAFTNSPIFSNIPIYEKLERILINYVEYLNPNHWFLERDENIRHRIADLASAHFYTYPLFVLGLLVCLFKIKDWKYRLVLFLYLITPIPAIVSSPTNLRLMIIVIPITMLCVVGIETVFGFLAKRFIIIHLFLFIIITIFSTTFLAEVFEDSCKWSKDYGLYGYQWGAKELFNKKIPFLLNKYPNSSFLVSTSWANSPEYFLGFFKPSSRVQSFGLDSAISEYLPNLEKSILVITPYEYSVILESDKIKVVQVLDIIYDPIGQPCFYFLETRYVSEINKILEEEAREDRKLIKENIVANNLMLKVYYQALDGGEIKNIFDGDSATLIRGKSAYPYLLVLKAKGNLETSRIEVVSFNDDLSIELETRNEKGEKAHYQTLAAQSKSSIHSKYKLKIKKENYKTFKLRFKYNRPGKLKKANIHINEIIFN